MEKQIEKQNGLTLIELLVVIVLLSIIAVIAVPRHITSPTLDAQTYQLLSDLSGSEGKDFWKKSAAYDAGNPLLILSFINFFIISLYS